MVNLSLVYIPLENVRYFVIFFPHFRNSLPWVLECQLADQNMFGSLMPATHNIIWDKLKINFYVLLRLPIPGLTWHLQRITASRIAGITALYNHSNSSHRAFPYHSLACPSYTTSGMVITHEAFFLFHCWDVMETRKGRPLMRLLSVLVKPERCPESEFETSCEIP